MVTLGLEGSVVRLKRGWKMTICWGETYLRVKLQREQDQKWRSQDFHSGGDSRSGMSSVAPGLDRARFDSNVHGGVLRDNFSQDKGWQNENRRENLN